MNNIQFNSWLKMPSHTLIMGILNLTPDSFSDGGQFSDKNQATDYALKMIEDGTIKDGFVHGTMLQNPYGQGYIGSYVMDKVRQGCEFKADAPWKSKVVMEPAVPIVLDSS